MKGPKDDFPGFPKDFLDDCDRPACDDTVNALKGMMDRLKSKPRDQKSVSSDASGPASQEIVDCPPTSPELGRATWTLLHSMAAWYPEEPTLDETKDMTNFFESLARFYPCTWCASDFRKNLAKDPVRTSNRKELCTWLCEQHNIVNQKIGKPVYPCDMKTLDERWRKSSDSKCVSDHHD